jgi:hypothetical protein
VRQSAHVLAESYKAAFKDMQREREEFRAAWLALGGIACQAEDMGGYPACDLPATLQTKSEPRQYYCAFHRMNRHVWRPEEELEPTFRTGQRRAPQDHKTCGGPCGQALPLSSFYLRSYAAGGGVMSICKTCHNRRPRNPTGRRNNGAGRHCDLCFGMPWRVLGAVCRCGCAAGPEPEVSIAAVALSRSYRGSFPGVD